LRITWWHADRARARELDGAGQRRQPGVGGAVEVDKAGKVTSARPYAPSGVVSFDRCITKVIERATFPGGPARVEAPIVFEPR